MDRQKTDLARFGWPASFDSFDRRDRCQQLFRRSGFQQHQASPKKLALFHLYARVEAPPEQHPDFVVVRSRHRERVAHDLLLLHALLAR